jgi:hypothetical protein
MRREPISITPAKNQLTFGLATGGGWASDDNPSLGPRNCRALTDHPGSHITRGPAIDRSKSTGPPPCDLVDDAGPLRRGDDRALKGRQASTWV